MTYLIELKKGRPGERGMGDGFADNSVSDQVCNSLVFHLTKLFVWISYSVTWLVTSMRIRSHVNLIVSIVIWRCLKLFKATNPIQSIFNINIYHCLFEIAYDKIDLCMSNSANIKWAKMCVIKYTSHRFNLNVKLDVCHWASLVNV